MIKKIQALIAVAIIATSCQADEEPNRNSDLGVDTTGSASLTFNNTVNGETLQLNTATYTNQNNESYKVSELKYIISNIRFVRTDGSEHAIPKSESYFLINEEQPNSKVVTLDSIPSGTYSAIRFGFGVDQSKYPIESGTLNFIPKAEEEGMLWSWSAGYRFLKFEGVYTLEGETQENTFLVHVGSHGSTLDNYQDITVPLSNFNINATGNTTASIKADIAKIFNGTSTYAFSDKNEITIDPVYAPIISKNMTKVFSLE